MQIHRTENEVRTKLSAGKYASFLKAYYPKEVKADEKVYWDPETGSCGFHARFTYDALGVKGKDDYKIVYEKDIGRIVELLDKGKVLGFLHNYPTDAVYFHLPKDNRYGNHIFVLVKGGDRYFLSQGYLHRYMHSLTSLTKQGLIDMLKNLIESHSDYEGTKTWGEIDTSLHKRYFKTDLRLFPNEPVQTDRKVHGIILLMETTKHLAT